MSNALGTSVGSKALTVRQAIYVGAICEFTGSLMGGEVAAAISGGILNMNTFQDLGDAGTLLYEIPIPRPSPPPPWLFVCLFACLLANSRTISHLTSVTTTFGDINSYGRCMFVTMCGAFVWLAVATYYSLPVSTTHSLVGSLIGVGVLSMSADGIKWATVGKIGTRVCTPAAQPDANTFASHTRLVWCQFPHGSPALLWAESWATSCTG